MRRGWRTGDGGPGRPCSERRAGDRAGRLVVAELAAEGLGLAGRAAVGVPGELLLGRRGRADVVFVVVVLLVPQRLAGQARGLAALEAVAEVGGVLGAGGQLVLALLALFQG